MKTKLILVILLCLVFNLNAQEEYRALFLGNSYTFYNQMPQMVETIAANMGEDLEVETNTPGGYTLEGHSTNATSLTLIQQGDWDFVVLQEQSQLPSFSEAQVSVQSFPFAALLNTEIEEHNPCAETLFYMTWGRENGDASNCESWPPVCTYEGMDDLLAENYVTMAEDNQAVVSPVGRVWRWIRENYPDLDLYDSDGSHPSAAGSYAAAVCFYTVMYRDNPMEITYNASLSDEDAEVIRTAVSTVLYDDFSQWFIGEYDLTAEFDVIINGDDGTAELLNTSENALWLSWDINGEEFTSEYVLFEADSEEFNVTLTVMNECDTVTSEIQYYDFINSIEEQEKDIFMVYPNPATDLITFNLKVQDIKVFDINGKELLDVTLNHTEFYIENLPNGKYFLHCTTESGEFSVDVIKE